MQEFTDLFPGSVSHGSYICGASMFIVKVPKFSRHYCLQWKHQHGSQNSLPALFLISEVKFQLFLGNNLKLCAVLALNVLISKVNLNVGKTVCLNEHVQNQFTGIPLNANIFVCCNMCHWKSVKTDQILWKIPISRNSFQSSVLIGFRVSVYLLFFF